MMDIADVLAAVGSILIIVGVYLVSLPLALITAGILAIVWAIILGLSSSIRQEPDRRNTPEV